MKPNELMYGDLVSCPNYENGHRVVAIDYLDHEVELDCDVFDIADIYPIPLTPEILEKNSDGGFFYHDSPIIGYDGKRSTCHIGRASLYVEWERISMKPYIEIHGLGDTFYKNYVASVHELQHALRLCGIEKEIVL